MSVRPVVLVTGATRGMGVAYARHLATCGYDLALTDISDGACRIYDETSSVPDLLVALRDAGARAEFYPADLTSFAAARAMVDRFLGDFGAIDAVVANAGGDISGADENAAGGKAADNSFFVSELEYERIFRRNYDTCLNTLRAIVPHMKNRGRGKIVTISSVNAGFGVVKETAYATAKATVVHLTRCLAAELRPVGVNVNCLVLGPTKTGRFMSTLKNRNPHDLQGLDSESRLDRVGRPQDVVPVLEFLVSPASDFVSGQILRVDGGLFTHPI